MANERAVLLEDVKLIFRNFEGKEGPYNRKGDRNFAILLDQETAAKMYEDGWNVKALKIREEGDPEQPYLGVTVNFRGRPPRVVMISSRGRTILDEEAVDILDFVDIATADVILNPYDWNVNGNTGTKAYLQTIFVTIEEDALERKYSGIEDIPTRSGRVQE